MRIVFLGASELGFKCCEQLILNNFNVVGVFTIPQSFNISYSKDKPVKNYLFKDFNYFSEKFNIKVIPVEKSMKSYEDQFKEFNPDLLIVIGWYYMIPKSIRDLAKLGCIGIHASLLPKYRGGAPLVWAMINGDTEAGVSLFHFNDGVDDGDIISQVGIKIEEEETIKDVLKKAEQASLEVLLESVPKIANGTACRVPQDSSKATYVPQRRPEDGEIDWNWTSKQIRDFIRAQTKPYPGAWTMINGKKLIIWDCDIL